MSTISSDSEMDLPTNQHTLNKITGVWTVVLKKKIVKFYIDPKGKFILSPQEHRQGTSSKGLSAEIDIPLRSPIQVQTKVNVA